MRDKPRPDRNTRLGTGKIRVQIWFRLLKPLAADNTSVSSDFTIYCIVNWFLFSVTAQYLKLTSSSFCSLSYDRSIASSKTSSSQSVI
jgi:hypothetical protein